MKNSFPQTISNRLGQRSFQTGGLSHPMFSTLMRRWLLLLFALVVPLHAQTISHPLPVGIWKTQGYGFIFNVQQDRVQEFDVLADKCQQTSVTTPIKFGADWGNWERVSTSAVETWRLQVSGMAVIRLDHLPENCALPVTQDLRPLANFDYFWNTFHTHYPFFIAHGVDWDAVRSELRPKAAALPDDGDVFPLLADMVTRLRDSHTSVGDGKRGASMRKNPYPQEMGPNGPYLIDDHYMIGGLHGYLRGPNSPLTAPLQTAGNGQIVYSRLKGSGPGAASGQDAEMGYIAILGTKQFSADETGDTPIDVSIESARVAMRQVVASLRGVRGLVVDIRYNGGGDDGIARAIAGFFTDHPIPAYSKRAFFNGALTEPYPVTVLPDPGDRLAVPIVFLTSDMTVSAAEVLALDLKALPNSIQLGQPTRGSLSDRLEKVLPNGWSLSLSNEIYTDVHSRIFEVTGVIPDVITDWPSPKAPDDIRFGRDIAAAVSKLKSMNR
jgi:carboxyl-terminal processing protease